MPQQQGVMSAYQLTAHTHQGVGQGGQLDHGAALVGLADDDHARYFEADGSKQLTGIFNFEVESASISAGEINPSRSYLRVETEGAAASDDLNTINGGFDGRILVIRAFNTAHTIVIKHGADNIDCGNLGDISLDSHEKVVIFKFSSTVAKWCFVAFSHILTKTRIDALNIDADTVDGEEANAITTNARVKAHFPDTIANILSDHNKANHVFDTLIGTLVWDPPNILDGAGLTSPLITVTGARVGDYVEVYPPTNIGNIGGGVHIQGFVSDDDDVNIRIENFSGAGKDYISGTWRVRVFQY